LRSETNFEGTIYRRDDYNTEFVNVGFDPFNPDAPAPSGGVATEVVETRTQLELHPNFQYRWSETMGVGVDLDYQDVKFSADNRAATVQQDYENLDAELFLERQFSRKTKLTVGATAGKFKAKDDSNITDSVGASLGLAHDWSEQTQARLVLNVERSTVDERGLNIKDQKSTDVGIQVSAFHRGEVSRVRFVVGRSLVPTGAGERTTRDEIRAQYDRDLSQRLLFRAAVRAYRQRPLTTIAISSKADRKVATGELALEWKLSPTWFVTGGYGYNWQDIATQSGAANNNRVFLSVGYRALGYKRNR
jgi:hypothetical protein